MTVIQIIFGKKGSGKTKRILDMANESIKDAKGHIIFVDISKDYTLNLKPQIRFVDASEYFVKGVQPFYGFIAGILAGNYDIDVLFIDSFLKLLQVADEQELIEYFSKLEKLTEIAGCKVVISYSDDPANVPECIRKYQI